MKEIDEYLKVLYKHVNATDQEIADMKSEMKSHLLESVHELQDEGKSVHDSVRIAIERFGDPNQIGRELPGLLLVSRRRLSKLIKITIGVALILLIGISIIIFSNIKEHQITLRQAAVTRHEFLEEMRKSQAGNDYYIGIWEKASKLSFAYGNSPQLSKALKVSHNVKIVDGIGEMNKTFKYHNSVLMAVAVIAADTDYECTFFKDIAELGVMKLSDSMAVVNLAEKAREAKTMSDKVGIQAQIQIMKDTSELKTYQEALEYNLKFINP